MKTYSSGKRHKKKRHSLTFSLLPFTFYLLFSPLPLEFLGEQFLGSDDDDFLLRLEILVGRTIRRRPGAPG